MCRSKLNPPEFFENRCKISKTNLKIQELLTSVMIQLKYIINDNKIQEEVILIMIMNCWSHQPKLYSFQEYCSIQTSEFTLQTLCSGNDSNISYKIR